MKDRVSDASEREQRLDELATAYLKAQEAGQTPDRQALLDSNPELASELREFFADQDRLERLAASPLLPDTNRTPLPKRTNGGPGSLLPPPPRSFGEYTVLAALGQGGMGVVWKARQRRPDRLVALKMFRAGDLASPTDVQRFRNEAEVIAQLDHPHILPVYEVGEHDGVHYFSMKLVEGGSLAAHPDSYRADPRSAARLLATIARAVHYAHQRGILHRDLKPSNILLDSEGQPHVSDFGLAKRVETDSSLTQSGTLVGTPSYMAPEQTSGNKGAVTTATDVYGLGAVLYALLTGRPPFVGETVLETMEQVKNREPVPPRRINPKVDRDLETICLKCLQKEPNRRYESAQVLAEDLERWLKGEPIRARRAGRWERLRKWVRRRPALASLIMVSILAVLGLLAGLLWHDAQLEEAARREHDQAEQARRERDAAEESRRWARQAVDDMYTEVAEKWLQRQPRLQPLQRDFLEKALRFYQHDAEQDGAVSAVQQRTGMAYYRLGGIQRMLGRHKEALEGDRKALTIFQKLHADAPQEAVYRYQLSACYHALGLELKDTGKLSEADQVLQQAIALCQRLLLDFPDRPQFRDHLAACRITHAGLLADTGRVPEAERAYRETLDMLEKSVGRSSADPKYRNTLATTYDLLSCLLVNIGRPREAEPIIRKALAILEKLATEHPGEPEYRGRWATNLQNLGTVLIRSGRAREAQEVYRQALTIETKLVADFPAVPGYRFDLATTQSNFGVLLRAAGQREEAMKSYEQAIAGMKTLAARFPNVILYRRHLGTFHGNMGNLLGDMGRHREREEAYRRALEIQRRLVADYPKIPDYQMDLAQSYENLGGVCQAMGRLPEAEAARLQALELREKLAATFPAVPRYRRDLANCCWAIAAGLLESPRPKSGPPRRALEFAKRSVELDDRVPRHWCVLGAAQYRAGNWGDARETLEKVLQLNDRGSEAFAWFYLAMAHWRLGNKVEARAWYDKGTRRMEQGKPVPQWLQRLHDESSALLESSSQRESKVVPSGKK